MKKTKKEELEIINFTTKYPTITKIFTILERKIDDQAKEISNLKEETSRLRKNEPI